MKEMDEVGLEGRYTKLPVEPDRQIADRPPPAWQTTRERGGGKPRMEARAKTTTAPSLPPLFSGHLCLFARLPFCILPVGQTRPRLLTTHKAKAPTSVPTPPEP